MTKNILSLTLGASWQVIPELIGFTNPKVYNFFKNHKLLSEIKSSREKYNIQPVDEVWIAITSLEFIFESINKLEKWHDAVVPNIKFRIFILKDVVDLNSITQCRQMGDLIYKMVFTASKEIREGNLILSLSGGRKTMSADMQEAGNIFGCSAMLHVVDTGIIPEKFKNSDMIGILEANISSLFMPIIVYGIKRKKSYYRSFFFSI